MSIEIVVEGRTTQEIAAQIAKIGGRIVKATVIVDDAPVTSGVIDDAWSADLRKWAAARPHLVQPADDSRDAIYGEGRL